MTKSARGSRIQNPSNLSGGAGHRKRMLYREVVQKWAVATAEAVLPQLTGCQTLLCCSTQPWTYTHHRQPWAQAGSPTTQP